MFVCVLLVYVFVLHLVYSRLYIIHMHNSAFMSLCEYVNQYKALYAISKSCLGSKIDHPVRL